jgi:NAD(P)-dependent dehydrogenase (short-subunit alcohol dehydrogenase family)
VTGAGRGIGRAVAIALAAEGARVAVAARTLTEIEATASACVPTAVPIRFDIGDEKSCQFVVRECEALLGPIDILVNSAGIAASAKFTELDTATWQRILRVDLDGPFWLCRATVGGMVARRSGAVIMIASLASRVGFPYVAAYTAAKHGVLGLTRSLAAEYARSGVTFNCVCPHYVDTPMTSETIANIQKTTGRTHDHALSALLTPQGRLVRPDEIAALCVLLASPAGRGINGQAINIDGGLVQS